MKRVSLFGQAAFYLFAGANHFINPEFYFGLIPDYLPYPVEINAISGVLEILFGIGLLVKPLVALPRYRSLRC